MAFVNVLARPSSNVKEILPAGDRLVFVGTGTGVVVTGGGAGAIFFTVTRTAAEVVLRFAVLVATAVSEWLAFVAVFVSQLKLYGAWATGAPRFLPSSLYWTLLTPCASLTLTVIVWVPLIVDFDFGLVMLILGAVGRVNFCVCFPVCVLFTWPGPDVFDRAAITP
jgi:hypothetical protein